MEKPQTSALFLTVLTIDLKREKHISIGQNVVLKTENLAVGYSSGSSSNLPVLSKINLEIQQGEIFALIGPNGCGKSTLLLSLAGQLPILEGQIWVKSESSRQEGSGEALPLSKIPLTTLARQMSLVLTDRIGTGQMLVKELLQLGRYPYTGWFGKTESEDDAIILSAMEQFALVNFENRPLYSLSDGERQRAALARAWVQQCPLILLDEPTHHLDIPAKAEIFNKLKQQRGERTIVLATHELELALKIADRIMLIHPSGKFEIGSPMALSQSGSIAEIYETAIVHFDAATGRLDFHI